MEKLDELAERGILLESEVRTLRQADRVNLAEGVCSERKRHQRLNAVEV